MQLQRLLFEPTLVRSPVRVLQWWESRRLSYNAIVGTTGVAVLVYANAISLLLGYDWFFVPWQAIVGYGIAANLCYTFGPVVECAVERWLKRPLYGLGPALFRHGLVFSVGLTIIPAIVVTIGAIAGKIFG
ncbi:MAG TPA: hypothetical protein VEB19_03905 [Gemmatimonadaceae bacterium]|nr:hypothetical protein [Gemmatimonadaceae bacterium]